MKVRILMATLVITLMLGVQGFSSPCDSACVDPCAACNGGAVKCDLFSGLKKLVNGVHFNNCDPCDGVVACNPCDDLAACNPCDDVCCVPKAGLGGRLRGLFASPACTPCDIVDNCKPCDFANNCDPCGNCCAAPKFTLRGLFSGMNRGCNTNCEPCNACCDPCDPCGFGNGCGDDGCGNGCGPRGHLIDLPRLNLGRLFGGLRRCDDGGCNPCDNVRDCLPCDACR